MLYHGTRAGASPFSIFLSLCEQLQKREESADRLHAWADWQSTSRKKNTADLKSTNAGLCADVAELVTKA